MIKREPAAADRVPQRSHGELCRVLIVDDHESTREMLGIALQIHGFGVEQAENGVDALEILATKQCNVVLTDYWMPEMNGVELLHEIRGRSEFACLPVIIMTAAHGTMPPQADEADAFLRKPFDSEALMRTLAKVHCTPH